MGACFSSQNQQDGDDLIPEQPVSHSVSAFLSSHVGKKGGEFWKNITKIFESSLSDTNRPVLKGKGCVPVSVDNPIEEKLWRLQSILYNDERARIERTEDGFVIHFGEHSYVLENFEMFLKQEISEGDFKDGLVRTSPDNYKEIWDILTSGMPFTAFYS